MLAAMGSLSSRCVRNPSISPAFGWFSTSSRSDADSIASGPLRRDLLSELTQLRVMIEPEVAALAAKNATTTETLRLYEAYEAMRRHCNDSMLAIETDLRFHQCLFAGAHNQLVASSLSFLQCPPARELRVHAGFKGRFHPEISNSMGTLPRPCTIAIRTRPGAPCCSSWRTTRRTSPRSCGAMRPPLEARRATNGCSQCRRERRERGIRMHQWLA